MKKTVSKKILAALLASAMVLSFTACGSAAQPETNTSKTESVAQSANTKTVTDRQGRTVEIPETVERIVPLGNAPRLLTYLGLDEKFVGLPECEHAENPIMAYAYVNKDEWANLPNVGTDSLGAGEWYAEEIIACKPDVIITTYTPDIADDIQRQTGIPVLSFSGNSTLFSDDYNKDLQFLGDSLGVSERAKELVDCITKTTADVQARTENVPDEKKPTVLGAGATFKGSHSIDGIYVKYPVFNLLHANDVAKNVQGNMGVLVDKEQILNWTPDIIFFDAGSMEMVNEDYKKDKNYFESLKAVQEGKLYQWPNSTWHHSNVEIPLVSLYYVGQFLYPEEFKDINFEEKASEIFNTFLGEPDYLNVLKDAGAGYGSVTLGN